MSVFRDEAPLRRGGKGGGGGSVVNPMRTRAHYGELGEFVSLVKWLLRGLCGSGAGPRIVSRGLLSDTIWRVGPYVGSSIVSILMAAACRRLFSSPGVTIPCGYNAGLWWEAGRTRCC